MNPYIKQFPDLMAGKKIMYVHGFLSSAQSGTVKMLQELMPNATLVAEDIPVHPEEGIEMLQKMAETENFQSLVMAESAFFIILSLPEGSFTPENSERTYTYELNPL